MYLHFCDRLFYHPTSAVHGHPEDFELEYESVEFTSDGNLLHGWFFPAKNAAKGTVVHCHGNAANITGHFKYVSWMPSHNWNVLCFDYQGYGLSTGKPSRQGTIDDTHAAIDYVLKRRDVDTGKIALFGQSLGGAVAIVVAAARNDLKGVAVEGAFASYQQEAVYASKNNLLLWGAASLFGSTLISPGLDPIDYVAAIAPTPTFFISGTADTICDPQQTINLHTTAGEPKSLWVIESGSHTGALTETNGEGIRRLDHFLSQCVAK